MTSSVAQSSWADLFRQDLSISRAIFFIGYSAYDLDIKRMLYEDPRRKEKAFFILGKRPKNLTVRKASRFGSVIKIDAGRFADKLENKIKAYKPPKNKPFLGHCIEKFLPQQFYGKIIDQSIFDLIMFGKTNPDSIWTSIESGEKYFCERDEINLAIRQIEHGEKVAVIHSEIGNGKSLFLEGVSCRATQRGFHVYHVLKNDDDLISEIDQIINSGEKILLVVDNYPDYFKAIEFYFQNKNSNSGIILSARTPIHEVLIDRLCKNLGSVDIIELPVDKLSDREIAWVQEFFDEYGLWGNNASWGDERKIDYLSKTCEAEFNAILLKLFESPHIISKFESLIEQISEKKDYYEITIGILSLSIMGYRLDFNTLIGIWGDKVIGSQFRRNPVIKQIIDFEMASVKIRSPAAAQFILQKLTNARIVVEVLSDMFRYFEKSAKTISWHKQILSALARFGNLQSIVPEKQKRAACINFYESIKNLNFCKKNPLFWFQYAISCLVFRFFSRLVVGKSLYDLQ